MTSFKKNAGRKMCTFSEDYPLKNTKLSATLSGKTTDILKIFKFIDENVIGRNTTFLGPYGRRKVVYCDYTTFGRGLQFIEDYIFKEVLPLYGDIRTSINVTAHQSSLYRQEACDILRHAVNVSNEDVVLFTGNSRNSALEKLLRTLDLEEAPVVFVGSCEHHSLLMPWIETGCKVVRVAETKEGFLDLVDLENKLQREKKLEHEVGSHPQFIGCFSATSDITGILADDIATTVLLHQFNAFSFWDYSTAASYVPLDMNPLLPGNDNGVHKDAIFFSGHKFIGGIQSSNVLVAKKQLFRTEFLEALGNVENFVPNQSRMVLQSSESQKEAEADVIIDIVRMGLAVHLKQTVGSPNILIREQKITKTVLSFIRTIPEIILLGNESHAVKRLPIFSFIVRHPRGVFLHHNFVCAILNDVFGIQACGGCACTGQYAHDLLGIESKLASRYEEILQGDKRFDCDSSNQGEHVTCEILKPGFIRISLPYFVSDSDINFILEAVKMVATEGWKLLPQYVMYPEIGEWKHRTNIVFRERKWLSSFRFVDGKMSINERKISGLSPFPQDPSDCLQMARNIFNKARKMAHRYPLSDQRVMFDENAEKLRWFMLPSEAQNLLLGKCQSVKTTLPFMPGKYSGTRNNSISSGESSTDSGFSSSKHHGSMLDVSSSLSCRHNSLTSFETGQLKSSSFFAEKSCSDCGCLSPFSPAFRREASPMSRTRCYSLESTSPSPSNQLFSSVDHGHCSCGSQTDISDTDFISRDHGSGDLIDVSDMGIHTLFPTTDNENLQAYVKGVTEELATEIKTEIREVIATVDNVLSESTENLELNHSLPPDKRTFTCDFRRTSSIPQISKGGSPQYSLSNLNENGLYCQRQSSSPMHLDNNSLKRLTYEKRSATPSCDSDDVGDQVAVYLAELTSEMVTEMKSELREMVNAVDEIISPSICDKTNGHIETTKTLPVNVEDEEEWDSDKSQVQDVCNDDTSKIEGVLLDIQNAHMARGGCKSFNKSDSSSDSGVAEVAPKSSPTKIPKRKISVIARETKSVPIVKDEIFETQMHTTYDVVDNETTNGSHLDRCKLSFESSSLQPKWHCPPKNVWKLAVEAIREFDMIREGDRVLVCLSGGKDSLSLLHTLHQYQCYCQSFGITFTFGAVTIDPENEHYEPRSLIPYLHALGVSYLYEKQKLPETNSSSSVINPTSIYKSRPCIRLNRNYFLKIAREKNYNVLALGQHFDDVAENFLITMFYQGKLRSMKAHYQIKEVRVIRPFVYVREKHLRQFTENRKLPVVSETCPTYFETPKERYRMKQLLAQQEILHPRLFFNMKSALLPLIGLQQIPMDDDISHKKSKHVVEDRSMFISSDESEN